MKARKVVSIVLAAEFALMSVVWAVVMPGHGVILYAFGLVVLGGIALACASRALAGHGVVRKPMIARAIPAGQGEAIKGPTRMYERNTAAHLA